jgi:RNA exonuclease 1
MRFDNLSPSQWSGITAETEFSCDLAEARAKLMTFVKPRTLLVGHSLDSDLRCLRLVHKVGLQS